MYKGSITDVEGIEVGHAQNIDAQTGCTVILCREGATAGVDVRGGAPGTRETDLARPGNLVEKMHGVILAGGSAFGLAATDGVMKYLEENKVGFDTGAARVPIVGGAVLYDLEVGDGTIRPDAGMGYQACLNAESGQIHQGRVGAGTGAMVGKVLGMTGAMKGGIGTASIILPDGIIVGAIVAVNAFGDVVDFVTGNIIAGARDLETGVFANTCSYILSGGQNLGGIGSNTTIGVIATNAKLNKEQVNRLATMGHNGLALSIRPVHTLADGDTLFALATGQIEGNPMAIGCAAVEVVARAINNAIN